MEDVKQSEIQDLKARYHHLDNRVVHISEDVASMKSTLSGFGDVLNRIANDIKPKEVSVTAWLGVAFVCLSLLGGGLLGASSYIDLQLAPIRQNAIRHEQQLGKFMDLALDQAREHGYMEARIQDLEADIEDVDKLGSRKWIEHNSAGPHALSMRDGRQ